MHACRLLAVEIVSKQYTLFNIIKAVERLSNARPNCVAVESVQAVQKSPHVCISGKQGWLISCIELPFYCVTCQRVLDLGTCADMHMLQLAQSNIDTCTSK